jgi:hypothetical protein
LSENKYESLMESFNSIGKMINGLISSLRVTNTMSNH